MNLEEEIDVIFHGAYPTPKKLTAISVSNLEFLGFTISKALNVGNSRKKEVFNQYWYIIDLSS